MSEILRVAFSFRYNLREDTIVVKSVALLFLFIINMCMLTDVAAHVNLRNVLLPIFSNPN